MRIDRVSAHGLGGELLEEGRPHDALRQDVRRCEARAGPRLDAQLGVGRPENRGGLINDQGETRQALHVASARRLARWIAEQPDAHARQLEGHPLSAAPLHAGGGRWGSSRRTGAIHHRCSSRRLATQRGGGGRVPGNSPSSRSAASSWSASGATSSELEARRRSRPRESASHTPTARPPKVMAARRSTSCHNGSGPLESAALKKTEEDKVPARPFGSTPLVRLQAFPSAVNCGSGATPPYSPYGIQMFLT